MLFLMADTKMDFQKLNIDSGFIVFSRVLSLLLFPSQKIENFILINSHNFYGCTVWYNSYGDKGPIKIIKAAGLLFWDCRISLHGRLLLRDGR